jgi:hypothetical protein
MHKRLQTWRFGISALTVITIIDDEKRSLVYHTDIGVIHHTFKSPVYGKDFRDLLVAGAECMEKYHGTKWLSDDRRNGPISPEDGTWGETIWGSRVIRAGFKFWAIVVPAHAVGSLQMHRFADQYRKRGVTVNIHDQLEPAWEWLKSAT